jgi:formylglycine-generating enzyme required for sulfatase activity
MFNRSNDPNYPATISTFRLDDYEITVGRFRQFVAVYTQDMIASGAGKNPNNLDDPGWDVSWNASLPANATELTSAVACDGTYQTWTPSAAGNENRPMNCLSWYEAEAFCTWDGGRLPTEAEWNYAAAGGNRQRMYPWGTLMPTGANFAAYGCYYNGTGPGTCTGTTNIAPVGAILDSKGDYGQYDLAGNVWEWVQDWWETTYPTMSCNDCAHLTGHDSRVNRGGSFMGDLSYLATSYRQSTTLPYRYYVLGARCARLP